MKIQRETRRVPLMSAPGRQVDGVVRTRGIDARARGQGFIFARQEPIAVIVRTDHGERTIPVHSRDGPPMALAVVPVAAYVAGRIWMRQRRRRRTS
jgi:hypothetical protein